MHILLFGGAFDPWHLGHLQVAKAGKEVADDVWFVPCGSHPFNKALSPAKVRLEILQLQKAFFILDYELSHSGHSFSIQTLDWASNQYPEHSFSWLLGSDQVANFTQWQQWEDVLFKYGVLVYPRIGTENVELLPGMHWLTNVKPISISSTQVREALREGEDVSTLLTPAVARYCSKYSLYT